MDIEIVDFKRDPRKFGPALVEIFIDCFTDIAGKVDENPSLGRFDTKKETAECSADIYRRARDMIARQRDDRINYYAQKAKEGYTAVGIGKNGKVIGGGNVVRLDSKTFSRKAHTSQLYIEPENQRAGIGSLILEALEDQAKQWYPEEKASLNKGTWVIDGDALVYVPTLDFYRGKGYSVTGKVIERVYRSEVPELKFPNLHIRKALVS